MRGKRAPNLGISRTSIHMKGKKNETSMGIKVQSMYGNTLTIDFKGKTTYREERL